MELPTLQKSTSYFTTSAGVEHTAALQPPEPFFANTSISLAYIILVDRSIETSVAAKLVLYTVVVASLLHSDLFTSS